MRQEEISFGETRGDITRLVRNAQWIVDEIPQGDGWSYRDVEDLQIAYREIADGLQFLQGLVAEWEKRHAKK